ncbi:hypothetical protein lotta81_gp009 [Flavobacterium phage vB_FspM_lotta8-1]|uniref:Uncharacterized protein n=3 Tax=Pippivirus TaxID=2843435 RepID=A0A6B9L8S0_9CAUD|nr:hypothetical protein HWC85_gp09 [Flavobacterium phage vB_FspM_lotta8-1]YP_009854540.1 hypothetical protein HWC86_gp09 [Flavobacterium phage vB_FspM_pippi8-1]QHB38467.1 hypothetical protein lotta81_gp009 [Flavobacterium phage vB_FspM_lotta8-1]QHB38520.1 hypothetical protein lotta82_gp009 [Flavobacterium phage vB_FspM_lotta8-2]QHB38573.1 hypothetical protein pippi81_gp009 [Flavobacterium phage vB_FspM_pippi8-1]
MKKIEEIEVKDARVCSGACEACSCKTVKTKENITFEASHWADAEKSVKALVQKHIGGKGFSRAFWFPRSVCTFSEIKSYGRFNITAPRWLLEKYNILDIITIVQNEK